MTRQQWQKAGALALPLLWLSFGRVSAQDARGSTGAVVEIGRMTTQLTSAQTIEYVSAVNTNDAQGRPITFYVHAKLRRPSSIHVTVSSTAADAPDAAVFVADGKTITGYNPQNRQTTRQTMITTGANLALPFGFAADEPAFATVRQLFGGNPFNSLLYGTTQYPLTLTRHGLDIPGAVMITAQWATDLIGQQRLAKLWVDIAGDTPRRLLIGEINEGAEHDHYIEDFPSFKVNPALPDDTFQWTPPATAQTPSAPADPPTRLTTPAKQKNPAARKPHHRGR